jgi:uncharacterized membrane protein
MGTNRRMSRKAATTINRPREVITEAWRSSEHRPRYIEEADATVTFVDAPGDRGTEIHVELRESAPAGLVGEAVQKITGREPLARVKDELRRFKQHVETGEVPRSDAQPQGESLHGKLRQRPAQPLGREELQAVGA